MTERLRHELVALFGADLVADAERMDLAGVTADEAREASRAATKLRKLQQWPRSQRDVVEAMERPAALLLCRRLMEPGVTARMVDSVYSNGRCCTPERKESEMEVLTVEEVAELLKIQPATVRKLFRAGELPGRKVGRDWRTTREALESYMNPAQKKEGP